VSAGLPVVVSVAAALVLALALERLFPHEPARASWLANAGLWAVATGLRALVFGGAEWQVAAWTESARFGLLARAPAPVLVAVPMTVLGLDLVSYLWHRANHRLALLWRFHRVHHADPALTAVTSLRFHPGEILSSLPVRLAAIALLGAPLGAVVAFEAVFGAANALEHANVDLPARLERALELGLITPALHRRHRMVSRAEHDANYGTIFSFWDRLGRSRCPGASSDRFPLGLAAGSTGAPRSLAAMLLEPFRRATR